MSPLSIILMAPFVSFVITWLVGKWFGEGLSIVDEAFRDISMWLFLTLFLVGLGLALWR